MPGPYCGWPCRPRPPCRNRTIHASARMIDRVERSGRGAQPEVPVEFCGDRRSLLRAIDALFPEGAGPIAPAVDFPHRPDDAGLEPFASGPQALARMARVAHLGDQPVSLATRVITRASSIECAIGFST